MRDADNLLVSCIWVDICPVDIERANAGDSNQLCRNRAGDTHEYHKKESKGTAGACNRHASVRQDKAAVDFPQVHFSGKGRENGTIL